MKEQADECQSGWGVQVEKAFMQQKAEAEQERARLEQRHEAVLRAAVEKREAKIDSLKVRQTVEGGQASHRVRWKGALSGSCGAGDGDAGGGASVVVRVPAAGGPSGDGGEAGQQDQGDGRTGGALHRRAGPSSSFPHEQ